VAPVVGSGVLARAVRVLRSQALAVGVDRHWLNASLMSPSKARRAVYFLVAATCAIGSFLTFEVIVPAYRRPTTVTYSTRLGYPALLRFFHRPIPVQTTKADNHRVVRSFLAEGTMASEPILVPMVPVGKIIGVYVHPGQIVHKGDLLAELDTRQSRLLAETTRLAFLSASAEFKRTKIGSVLQENREQAERDTVDVKALENQVKLLRDEVDLKEKLFDQALVSQVALLEAKRTLAETEQAFETARVSLQISSPGKNESMRVAANAAQQAELLWQDALEQLNECKVVAPADGIIDRVLVHSGEFNQAPGGPALVLSAGLWFEAYFDQAVTGEISKDAEAEVHLSARPEETFKGRVANINPIVSYSTGGPETSRPIRPIGTGAPEWPATFQVRIELPPSALSSLVPGLTGFARVTAERECVAVPQGAVTSMSAGDGLLFVVHGPAWEIRRAQYGAAYEGWLEVKSGVSRGEKVIVLGQRALEPGDKIDESPWAPSFSAR
jgi:HlyD family secretion protein